MVNIGFGKRISFFLLLAFSHHTFFYADEFSQKNVTQEVESYKKLVTDHPKNVNYLLALGQLYESGGEPKDAIELYKRALKLEPERQDIRIRLGYAYFKDKDLTSSQEIFQAVLTKEPDNIEALIGLGQIETRHKHNLEAQKYFETVLNLDPQNSVALLKLADLFRLQNHNVKAYELYEKVLKLQPSKQYSQKEIDQIQEKASSVQAKSFFQEKRYNEALAIYEKLVIKYPDNVSYLLALGQIYTNLDQPKEAIELYKRALNLKPERQDIRVRLGFAYLKDKDLTSSQELFQAVLLKKPDNIRALMGLGLIKARQKEIPEAKKHFEAVLNLDSENILALLKLADLRMSQNEDREAYALYSKVLKLDPGNQRSQKGVVQLLEKALLEEAKSLTNQKCYYEATLVYEKIVALAPKNVDYYLLLGNSYLRLQCFCNAIEVFRQALQIKPANTEMKDALAFAYLRQGTKAPLLWNHYQWFVNYPYLFYFIKEDIYPRVNWRSIETSRDLFEEVLAEKPQDADALTGMGRVEALNDNKRCAEYLYCEALALQPNNTTTLAYYASLLASEGRYFSARDTYRKLLSFDPCDKDIYRDYIDVVNNSDPIYSLLGFYSEENEQDLITATKRAWTARLKDYGGGFSFSCALRDRLKLFGLVTDEYIVLKNLINHSTIYSLGVVRANVGFSWNYSPYLSVLGGCGFSSFAQHHHSTFRTKRGCYVQPFLNLTYSRWHHTVFIETYSDAPIVARNFTSQRAALIDRQFLRAFYEYNFGNRTLFGCTAANIWYINRIKSNQQQLASTWLQWSPPCFWQYLAFRYQFIYSRFNRLTPDYYTFRFQTTHWLTVTLSKSWWDNSLITEAGYGYAYQRSFEQGQIIVVNPVTRFRTIHREINAAFARVEYNPNDCIKFAVTGTYTLDSFNYTTASVTGRLSWRF